MVFASLRRPKRLTLRCSDARPRSFLVKGGEDLRNDDRIQQLFAAMRRELERADAAPAGRRARLTLRTYAVVPLTPRLGLIEWVADAAVLKSVMNAQWGARGTAALLAAGRARDSALGLDNRDYKSYHTSYQTKTRADAEGALARARAQLEAAECGAGALRRHLVATAQSPEALFSLRASFARSLGASSAACYLVGLGDRHLENMMLDRGDASIVHIDLAASFGLGASALPVPEFQPFRLTAELRAALAPTDARQVISHHIAASLERLQAPRARAALLATLDVFVREPVLDWLHHLDKSRKRRKDGADAAADDPLLHTWSPQRKVDAARDKLDGVHPLRVLLDELRCNPVVAARQSFAAIETILRSAAPGHPLADDDRPILAVPDQVAVLVGLATEPNVIARQWQGLTPWL
ncbi:kinase-like domain-containing protein [Pelagophyceae sp. CCMP2097]|nr:kinase-like domain-containing protein [Pelagophyceae sp. CCMP2097]